MKVRECSFCNTYVTAHAAKLTSVVSQVAALYGYSFEEAFGVFMSTMHGLYEHLTPVDSEDPSFPDFVGVENNVISIHNPTQCAGRPCVFHNPSDHALSKAKVSYNESLHRVERVCSHGIHHPDVDEVVKVYDGFGETEALKFAKHNDCDGCCLGGYARLGTLEGQ